MVRAHRCKRIKVEVWKAPGGAGNDWPGGTLRDMQARCVLNEGHLDVKQDHIWGDWMEVRDAAPRRGRSRRPRPPARGRRGARCARQSAT